MYEYIKRLYINSFNNIQKLVSACKYYLTTQIGNSLGARNIGHWFQHPMIHRAYERKMAAPLAHDSLEEAEINDVAQ